MICDLGSNEFPLAVSGKHKLASIVPLCRSRLRYKSSGKVTPAVNSDTAPAATAVTAVDPRFSPDFDLDPDFDPDPDLDLDSDPDSSDYSLRTGGRAAGLGVMNFTFTVGPRLSPGPLR